MSTQNERELFREYATNKGWNTSPEQNNCGIVVYERFKHPKVQLAFDVWRDARTPLLSRIAELERQLTDGAQAIKWATSSAFWASELIRIFGADARDGINDLERQLIKAKNDIDALSKDAERLDLLTEFCSPWSISCDKFGGKSVRWIMIKDGHRWGKWYFSPREAIDAAISAREGE